MIEFVVTVFKVAYAAAVHFVRGRFLRLKPPAESPVVTVRQGALRGVTAQLPNGSSYHYFKGIPYAKAPIGELRFRAPVPLEKFDTPMLDCFTERSDCVQRDLFTNYVIGSEKGLYLNVYTPGFAINGTEGQKRQPVMVFIHGGGFLSGTGSSFFYEPAYFVQEGVVMVTMNYRLGPLGFLNFPSAGIPGNAGLKDQLLVLKWIKENITQFGGDPDNVTIFGESAGSISAYLHYLSTNSRKYFNRLICQSGIPCTETFFQTAGDEKARMLARLLGYKGNSDEEALATLLKAPASALINNQHRVITKEEKRAGVKFAFMPVIEEFDSEDSIITKHPEEIIKMPDTLTKPLVEGCNSGEGILSLFLTPKSKIYMANQEPELLVPVILKVEDSLSRTSLGKQIKWFYFGDKPIDKTTRDQFCNAMADNYFITNSMIHAEWIAKYQPNMRHYHYRFMFDGRFSITKKLFNQVQVKGACHGDDVFYMFSPSYLPDLPEDSAECRIRQMFIKLWTNFSKYDDPTPNNDDNGLGFKWTPVAKLDGLESEEFNLDCLEIDVNPRMIRNPYPERMQFWRTLLKQHRSGFL